MPRCVTNWEQRTAAAAGKVMHIHKTNVGGTAVLSFFLYFSLSIYLIFFLSLSLSLSLFLLTHITINTRPCARGEPAFTRGAVSSCMEENAQQSRKADTTIIFFVANY